MKIWHLLSKKTHQLVPVIAEHMTIIQVKDNPDDPDETAREAMAFYVGGEVDEDGTLQGGSLIGMVEMETEGWWVQELPDGSQRSPLVKPPQGVRILGGGFH